MRPSFVQFNLNILNFLIILYGSVLCIISSILVFIYLSDYYYVRNFIYHVVIALIIVALLLFATAAIAFYAFNKLDFVLILVIIIALVLNSLALAGISIWTYFANSNYKFLNEIENTLNHTIKYYNENENNSIDTLQINLFQKKFQCCGLESYRDWSHSYYLNSYKINLAHKFLLNSNQIPINVPDSCCKEIFMNCGKDYSLNKTIYQKGCKEPLKNILVHLQNLIISISSGVSFCCVLSAIYISFNVLVIDSDYNIIKQLN